MTLILDIPTLNDDIQDFEQLFSLHQQAINCDRDKIVLDFSNCNFLRHNAVAFLGGLVRFNQKHGKTVIIDWDTIQKRVCTNLRQNGFYTAHTGDSSGWAGNSIPYREERLQDKNSFLEYLRDRWLAKGCVNIDLDEDAKREILGKVVEIYVNACELVPRGTGLDALKNFVKEHEGKLEILSDRGYVVYSEGKIPSSGKCSTPFAGTIVNITLKCLNWQYHQFTTVDIGEPLF